MKNRAWAVHAVILSAIIVLPLANCLCAQERQNSLTQQIHEVKEVVVTSPKIGRNLSEIPASMNVVTSLEAKKASSFTIADVLKREAGLFKGGDGIWSASINVHGFSENRLVTLVDRNRVETATDLTASLSMIDVNDVASVEVIKGAQSSIYGSGAMGGIINVITKEGYFAQTPYCNANFTTNFSTVNKGHGEYLALYAGSKRWFAKVNGTFTQAQDIKTPCGEMPNSGYNSCNVGAILAFKPMEGHILKLQFQRNGSWDVGVPGGASFSPVATASYKDISRTMASVSYEISGLRAQLELLRFKAFFQGIDRDVEMLPNAPKPESGAMPTLVTPNATHNTFGFNAEGTWKFSLNNSMTTGAEVWQRRISSIRKKFIDQYSKGVVAQQMIRVETPLPEASYLSSGIFAQDEWRLWNNRLILSFGARADVNFVHNGECHNVERVENVTKGVVNENPDGKYVTFDSGEHRDFSWSGNAGVLFKATKDLDLTFNVSRYYRSPALEEMFKFIDLTGNIIHFGNPALKPERGLSSDVGLRYHGDRLSAQISFFANGIHNMIIERKVNVLPDSVNDTLVLSNVGRALMYGFDFSTSYTLLRGLDIFASGTMTIGKERSGDTTWLPMIPPLNGVVGVEYKNNRLLGAKLELVAAADRKEGHIALGESATSAWSRLDMSLSSKIFTFGLCHIQLFAGVDNLTNYTYTNFLSTNRGNIICEPGRNIFFRVNVTI